MVKESKSKSAARAGPDDDGKDGGVEFYAKVDSGYTRSDDDAGAGTGSSPPPVVEGTSATITQKQAPPPPEPVIKVDMSSPESASRVLAETMVRSFVDKMKAVAEAKGGHLSVKDLEDMQSDFDRQAEALSGALAQSFEVYVKARERSVWDQQRSYPFDRLMVKKFSHLFNEGETLGPDDLSRRMLPGFFVALGMMLGPDVVDEHQEKLRGVVERVKAEGKSVFNWDDVYKDKTSQGVSLNAEVAIARHFDEYDKRSEWFINMVNDHLAPAEPGSHPNAVNWQLTLRGFEKFLGALLEDLRGHLETDTGKMAITRRYGGDSCAALYDILALVA